jgi:hypothetical protein
MVMHAITGLLGRDALVDQVVREVRKGKHVLLTGPTGIGKSAVLHAALDRAERHGREADPVGEERRAADGGTTLIRLTDHQAKGQFVDMARQCLEAGILKPRALDLPERLEDVDPAALWPQAKRHVNRLSMRELAGSHRRAVIAVDDLTHLTPTQQAFWLAVFEHAQVVGCTSEKRQGVRKLWWRMKEIEVPPLTPEAARAIVSTYITSRTRVC